MYVRPTLSDRAQQARVRNVASHVPPFGIPTDFRADSEPSQRAKKAPTSGPNGGVLMKAKVTSWLESSKEGLSSLWSTREERLKDTKVRLARAALSHAV